MLQLSRVASEEDRRSPFSARKVGHYATDSRLSKNALLGTDYSSITYYARCQDDVETYCRAPVVYPNAVATLQVGIGVKSEGSMVISGTKGYIYVPAPWWRTDYFEVRFEDQNQTRKFYYNWEGEGLRYETQEFLRSIRDSRLGSPSLTQQQVMAIAKAVQQFNERKKYYIL